MRIKKIKIQNFKKFKNLTIDLTKHQDKKIIALVGKNGSGKSTIFETFIHFLKNKNKKNTNKNSVKIEIETNSKNELDEKYFRIRSSYRISVSKYDDPPSNKLLNDYSLIDNINSIDSQLKINWWKFISQFWVLEWEDSEEKCFEDETVFSCESGKCRKCYLENVGLDEVFWEEKIRPISEIFKKITNIEFSKLIYMSDASPDSFEFKKEKLKNISFDNLSSGEKAILDLILDLFIMKEQYEFYSMFYCIEEPELHINSSIQKNFLIEISKLIPSNSQLWITTHSFGFINTLLSELRDESAIIHLSDENNVFNHNGVITPIEYTKNNIKKILAVPLLEMSKFIFPKKVFVYEGKFESIRKISDAEIYETIFKNKLDDILFISKGGYAAVKKFTESLYESFFSVVDTKWISLVDGDAQKDDKNKITETIHLKRKAIENYLFDLEILKKINPNIDVSIFNSLCLDIKNCNFKNKQKHIQELCNRKNTDKKAFLYEIIEKVNFETQVYQELEKIIFKNGK